MKCLGLDLGERSLGIAISDRTKTIASFYKNLKFSDVDQVFSELDDIFNKEDISLIVLGYPKNMNNSVGERGVKTEEFKSLLEEKYKIKVVLEDERLTTRIAESILVDADLSRKKRKKVIDGVSAVVILQSYLDREENKNGR